MEPIVGVMIITVTLAFMYYYVAKPIFLAWLKTYMLESNANAQQRMMKALIHAQLGDLELEPEEFAAECARIEQEFEVAFKRVDLAIRLEEKKSKVARQRPRLMRNR